MEAKEYTVGVYHNNTFYGIIKVKGYSDNVLWLAINRTREVTEISPYKLELRLLFMGNNGNDFADFIRDNDIYHSGKFLEYYDKYLPKIKSESFYEDFIYRMEVELKMPINC